MVDFVLGAGDVRAAPPIVRQWLASLVAAELDGGRAQAQPIIGTERALAALGTEEAGQLLEEIRDDGA
jgi:hypothetical protein